MAVFRNNDRIRKLWQPISKAMGTVRLRSLKGNTLHHSSDSIHVPRKWRKPLLILGTLLVLLVSAGFGGNHYIQSHMVEFYHVYKDGEEVGTVSDPDIIRQMLLEKVEQIEQDNPHARMVVNIGRVTYTTESAYKAVPDTEATVKKLEGMITSHAVGIELAVDGKVIAVVKDQETADEILSRIQAPYAHELGAHAGKPEVKALSFSDQAQAQGTAAADGQMADGVLSIGFIEEIGTETVQVEPSQITDPEEVYKKLTAGDTKETQYTVQAGDCVGCIANKFGISPEVIYHNNPWIEDDVIRIGDVLDLTVLQPALTVETVENVTEIEIIEPSIIIEKNDEMRAGEQKVIREGLAGKKQVTYQLTKQNGYLMMEDIVSEQVIEEPIDTIIQKGTKVILGEGTGKFAYPVKGYTITSKFGKRWGRQHKGIDLIGNKNILASDNGVVEFVGTKSGYGKMVLINHKNGFKTLYAHMSSLSVKKGQIVEKGEKLGIMGNTGNSKGTHLHFEIHKNGTPQNPLNHL